MNVDRKIEQRERMLGHEMKGCVLTAGACSYLHPLGTLHFVSISATTAGVWEDPSERDVGSRFATITTHSVLVCHLS